MYHFIVFLTSLLSVTDLYKIIYRKAQDTIPAEHSITHAKLTNFQSVLHRH